MKACKTSMPLLGNQEGWMLNDPERNMEQTVGLLFRNMRSKGRCSHVLQFTFRRAVSCVLHRPPSQVIHCRVLYLASYSTFVPNWETTVLFFFTSHHGVSTSNPSSQAKALTQTINSAPEARAAGEHREPLGLRQRRTQRGKPMQTGRGS